MVLIQESSFYSHFEIVPCLFERIAQQSCAFCNIAQNVNKRKILVLKPSLSVGFERPFKTASSVLKKNQNWTV